jgi:hypothetical protein
MSPGFVDHLQRNWPLLAVVVVGAIYVVVGLTLGVLYTNQGKVYRAQTPRQFWHYVQVFGLLLLACTAVLVGSYFFSR